MSDWLENDELFKKQLAIGHANAEHVAGVMRGAGVHVEVTPYRVRDRVENRHHWNDEFDLLANSRRIEVKSRSLDFTGPRDYPKDTAFVYSLRGWRAKTHRPAAIVLVSQARRGLAVIPASTERRWIARRVKDRERRIEYTVLEVRRELLVPIDALIDWLQPKTIDVHPPAPAVITADMINWSCTGD